MKKIKEWLWRYVPAEIFGVIGTIIGVSFFSLLSNNLIVVVYAGSIAETIGYYGFIALWDFRKKKIKHADSGKKIGFFEFLKNVRDLIFEFGFSEALDSLFVRPLCMYWFAIIFSDKIAGIIAGKFAADLVFYIPTIAAYEIKNKYARDKIKKLK